MAKANKGASDSERSFKVIKGTVGPYPPGHVFSESDFRKRHPLTGSEAEKNQVNASTYHGDLLGRLLSLKVIEPAAANEVPSSPPIGPLNMPTPTGNSAIHRATTESLENKRSQETLVEATKKEAEISRGLQTSNEDEVIKKSEESPGDGQPSPDAEE